MNARMGQVVVAVPDVSMSGMGFIGTAVFAVLTLGAAVTMFATFVALLVGGCAGPRGVFALVAGLMAFAILSLVQFLRWAVVLLRTLRGRA